MAALEARLRRLQEAAFQREVDRELAKWEPVLKACGYLDSARDDREDLEFIMRAGTQDPEAIARRAVEPLAVKYDIVLTVDEFLENSTEDWDRVCEKAKELGIS